MAGKHTPRNSNDAEKFSISCACKGNKASQASQVRHSTPILDRSTLAHCRSSHLAETEVTRTLLLEGHG